MDRLTFEEGEMGLCPRCLERWVDCGDMEHLLLTISDRALEAAGDGVSDKVELRHELRLVDKRLAALVAALNGERMAGFSSGPPFPGFWGRGIAPALVAGYSVRRFSRGQKPGGVC